MSLRTSSVGGGIIYKLINSSPVASLITGGVYIGTRPADSKKEDVVVRPRTITMDSGQKQFIDILAFVPDIKVTAKTFEPDIERLSTISKALLDALNNKHAPAWSSTVQEAEDQIEVDIVNFHAAFLRVYFIIYEPIEL